MDWKKLGLKVGLELHQQINTHKLFCSCPSMIREKQPDFTILRKQRAVIGELGKKDIAALSEESKDKTFVYEGYKDTTCLVETDSEPPHPINQEALKVGMKVAMLLKMQPFDEIQVMRKTVIDGSNTSGFQRTALIAENGFIETTDGLIRVNMLALEEDSARRIRESGNAIHFRLDRLGIPLLELRTEPDIKTPEQAKEAAEKIGLLMRMTGGVKRGIGTIRQDVNVSIKGGSRIEIKGFQDLREIPKVIESEVARQHHLLQLKNKLKKRNAKAIRKFKSVANILKDAKSKLVKAAIESGSQVIGMKLKGFGSLLRKTIQGERTFAKEFVDYLKHFTDMKGFLHTDELPNYGITENQAFQLKKFFGGSDQDVIVFVFGDKDECEKALNLIANRAEQFVKGVPSEVRDANPDNTTRFLRPMPGSARMYPETDEFPFAITKGFLDLIEKPETPERKLGKYKNLGLSEELSWQMIHSEEMNIFEMLAKKFKKINSTIIASNLLSARDEIRKRYEANSDNLNPMHFEDSFKLLESDKIAKEAVIEILAWLARNPSRTAGEAMKKLKLSKISKKELGKITERILHENPKLVEDKQFGVLMGFLMRKVRGRIDGELVAETLKKKLGFK